MARHCYSRLILFLLLLVSLHREAACRGNGSLPAVVEDERSFTVDFENDTFLMDGKPFRYVSGSFHYFRAPHQKWRQLMKTIRGGGLNAVDIYIQWSLHNPKDGVYNWDGIANITDVIEAAKEADLYVILRPGPYICAEIDNGGVPYWLFNKHPNIKLRVNDNDYRNEIKAWYDALMPQLEQYMYGNGGPIIMVQVENEYGAYGKCDPVYKNFLRDQTKKHVKDKALLFTVDRPIDDELSCGKIDDVFVTTDFGLANDAEVDFNWWKLRQVQPHGPLVNTEFYTGWLTHWQEPNQRRPAEPLANTLRKMLQDGANVNFYMYFGGTNFGFWAGANDWGLGDYQADITSYDYDAPMDEAGNPTEKYSIFRDVIKEFIPDPPEVPQVQPARKLDSVTLISVDTILSKAGIEILGSSKGSFQKPPTFEELDQNAGFILYETDLPKFTRDPSELKVEGLRDRALVYIDQYFVGVLARENAIKTLPISAGLGQKLQILVENQGRINFNVADDYKGILGEVTFQQYDEPYYIQLTNWTVIGFPLDDPAALEKFSNGKGKIKTFSERGVLTDGPTLFKGEFDIEGDVQDTYIDLEGWGKGIVFVNSVNLGRYWPLVGPQRTLYVPKVFLESKGNQIYVLEYQKVKTDLMLNFSDKPKLD